MIKIGELIYTLGAEFEEKALSNIENGFDRISKSFLTAVGVASAALAGTLTAVKEFASAREDDNGVTKHHPDFVSKYGIEQATGHNWVWSEKIDDERAVILGGDRDDGVGAGSRASSWSVYVWNSLWYFGCRFACDSLNPV